MKKHLHEHPKSTHQHKNKSSKRTHPKSIRRRKKKSFKPKPKSAGPKYRWIEDLHNFHKGEEVWVLGSGPSLDDFPNGFFDEEYRIAIAVKWSMIAFPNCTYSTFSRGDRLSINYILKNRRHLLHKHIVHLRPKSSGSRPIGLEPIYMRVSDPTAYSENRYRSLPKYLLAGTPIRYPAISIIHWDIQAAIIMGAKKITLVGCEARTRKFQWHALKRGMNQVYGPKGFFEPRSSREHAPAEGYPKDWQTGEEKGFRAIRNGTKWLAKYFAPYGIQIAEYYYGKGYEKII